MLSPVPSFAPCSIATEALQHLTRALRGKRVLVVGDVMLDEYLVGDVRRISPEAPVPVVELTHRAHVPGGAANVAANVASLGGQATLVGVVGDDENARILSSLLEAQHVKTGCVLRWNERATITKTRIVSGQQQIVRVDREDKTPVSAAARDAILQSVRREIANTDGCVLSDYGKGLLDAPLCGDLIALCHQLGKPVAVDPKGSDYRKYAGSTVVTPNLREAERATGLSGRGDADLLRVADRLHEILGGSALLITRGADGMTLFRPDHPPVHAHAMAREVFDVTGAGDTVAATLTLALASGATLIEAMAVANIAASVVVQKTGTATLTADELLAAEALPENNPAAILPPKTSSRSYLSVPNGGRISR